MHDTGKMSIIGVTSPAKNSLDDRRTAPEDAEFCSSICYCPRLPVDVPASALCVHMDDHEAWTAEGGFLQDFMDSGVCMGDCKRCQSHRRGEGDGHASWTAPVTCRLDLVEIKMTVYIIVS